MTNPLVHPGIDGIEESSEYNMVDEFIDTHLDGGRLVGLESKHGADLYVAFERIAADRTGYDACPLVDVDDDVLTDATVFAADAGVQSEAGGHALYRLVSNAVDHHDVFDDGHKLQAIATHYSTNNEASST